MWQIILWISEKKKCFTLWVCGSIIDMNELNSENLEKKIGNFTSFAAQFLNFLIKKLRKSSANRLAILSILTIITNH